MGLLCPAAGGELRLELRKMTALGMWPRKSELAEGSGAFLTGCPNGTLLARNALRVAGAKKHRIPNRDVRSLQALQGW